MRYVVAIIALGWILAITGCGSGSQGPVTVTPEMEAEQKKAEQKATDEEQDQAKQRRAKSARPRN